MAPLSVPGRGAAGRRQGRHAPPLRGASPAFPEPGRGAGARTRNPVAGGDAGPGSDACRQSIKQQSKRDIRASQLAQMVKNSPPNAGDVRVVGLIPGSGKSPGGELGDPLPYSYLEDPMAGYGP